MSDSPDNVVRLGGSGGLLYQDAREQARRIGEQAGQDFAMELPEPEPPPEPIKAPKAPTVATPKNLPEPEPEPGRDWRELISTCVELLGVTLVSVGGWLIAPYVGLIIAGLALIAFGVATSGLMSGE